MTITGSFTDNVNHIAGLDNSFALQMNVSKNNVALTAGTVYNTLSTLTMYNRTTGRSEVTTITAPSITVATLDAHLAAIKTQIELAYPIVMTHAVTTVGTAPLIFTAINIGFTVSGSLYYIRDFDLQINLLTDVKYLISGTLVSPVEVIPKLALELSPTAIDNIIVVGSNIASVNTVTTNVANVNTVAGSIANIYTVAGVQNLANITRVAQDLNALDLNGIADVTIVANDLVLGVNSKINKVSADLTNINLVSADLANIDTVALNIPAVNGAIAAAATANADVVLTHADVVLTHADVVLTHADAAASTASAAAASASQTAAGISASAAATSATSAAGSATTAANTVAPFTAHLTNILNPHSVTKVQVGLGNVADIAQVTSVSATAPLVSSGTTTPTISMAAATALANGYMTSIYASKLDGIATGATANVGTVTSVAAITIGSAGTDVSSTVATGTTTPVISLQLPSASALNRGLLTAADWAIFNAKSNTNGTVTSVSGTAPISIATGTTTPSISMAAATAIANGYMTSTYASKLDGIASGAQVNVATNLTATAGTVAGPTINSSTGTGIAIPSASVTESGIITTGAQTFAGVKTLTSPVLVTPSIGVATGTSFNSITGLASVAPLAPAVTAVVGTSTLAAREDHIHPTNFTVTATDIKMNGAQSLGALVTHARADHVHPSDTSKANLATSVQKDSSTGAAYLPVGTTAQRPVTPADGFMRYNTDLVSVEVYSNGAWGSVGGGATGGGTDHVFVNTEYTINNSYTIPAGKSSVIVSDSSNNVYFAAGVQIDFSTGSKVVVL